MINFENVSKYAISGIDLHIPKGEVVGIIGSTGAGKTTLLKLACGLLAPESGQVRTLGKDPVKHRSKYGSDLSTFFAGELSSACCLSATRLVVLKSRQNTKSACFNVQSQPSRCLS